MKPGCPERRLDRVTEGDHARFLTPKHTLCILYPESLPAEACNSALESRGSLIRSHSGPRSLSRKIRWRGRPGGERALPLGKFSPGPEAVAPEFHKSHRSERRLSPPLTPSRLFRSRFRGRYLGRAVGAVAHEAGT